MTALDDAIRRRAAAAAEFAAVFVAHFEAQARALRDMGPGPVDVVFDVDHWNKELTAALVPVAWSVADAEGARVAEHLGGVYEPKLTGAWLAENSRIAAEGINGHVRDLVEEMLLNTYAPDDALHAAGVPVIEAMEADAYGFDRANVTMNFATTEAGQQVATLPGLGPVKTWTVVSSNPRPTHAAADGESVPLYDLFSNGLQYPGDPAGDVSETAGCTCLLSVDAGPV